jgi:hypothetical protein
LQNAGRNAVRLLYCVFDLLYCDGRDLRDWPLLERKEELAKILPKSKLLLWQACRRRRHQAFKAAKRAGEEGVMAKLASGRYHSGQHARMAEGQGESGAGSGDRRLHRRAARENISARSCLPCEGKLEICRGRGPADAETCVRCIG